MALTTQQRSALPDKAFAFPKQRKYAVPTKKQAKKAGISEEQRLKLHRDALSRAVQRGTSGTYAKVAKKVQKRTGGKVGVGRK